MSRSTRTASRKASENAKPKPESSKVDIDHLTELQVLAARQWIRNRAHLYCNGDDPTGIGKLAPLYVEVTEGRDHRGNWTNYSSCGDLSQKIAFELGLRDGTINRDESGTPWKREVNLLRFYSRSHRPDGSDPVAVTPGWDYVPACGDIGFIWLTGSDAHTFVFGERIDDRTIETLNYGAKGCEPVETPGGIRRESRVVKNAAGLWQLGSRLLHKVATVPALLARASVQLLPDWSS